MGISGEFTRPDVDPHFVGQLLAALRGNQAQRRRILDDLRIMRLRGKWTERDWKTVYALHRELDVNTVSIEKLKARLKEAGVKIDL